MCDLCYYDTNVHCLAKALDPWRPVGTSPAIAIPPNSKAGTSSSKFSNRSKRLKYGSYCIAPHLWSNMLQEKEIDVRLKQKLDPTLLDTYLEDVQDNSEQPILQPDKMQQKHSKKEPAVQNLYIAGAFKR